MSTLLALPALSLALSLGCGPPAPRVGGRPPIPESHPVSGEQAMRLMLGGALLVDVSDRMTYYGRHLEGALNVPYDQLEARLDELPRDRPLVIYSFDGANTEDADLLLRSEGFDVHLLGRFADWSARPRLGAR